MCIRVAPKSDHWSSRASEGRIGVCLGGADKFEPVSGGGDMDHAKEAVDQLVVSGGDRSVNLEVPEHALDAVTLFVERPVVFDLHPAV